MIKKDLGRILLISCCLLVAAGASGFVASSTNYVLQSDSLNFGGLQSGSANYSLEDTFGELGTGYSSSTTYNLHAGYQQQSSSTLTLTTGLDITLSAISGKQGASTPTRSASDSTGLHVVADSATGYSLYVKAATSPAFAAPSRSFADYSPSGTSWTLATTESKFGFSPSGSDIVTTADKWYGLSTTNFKISGSATNNHPTGATTTLTVKAEAGLDVAQPYGSYSAQLTVTATAN